MKPASIAVTNRSTGSTEYIMVAHIVRVVRSRYDGSTHIYLTNNAVIESLDSVETIHHRIEGEG